MVKTRRRTFLDEIDETFQEGEDGKPWGDIIWVTFWVVLFRESPDSKTPGLQFLGKRTLPRHG